MPLHVAGRDRELIEPVVQQRAKKLVDLELIDERSQLRGLDVAEPVLFTEFEYRSRFSRADDSGRVQGPEEGDVLMGERQRKNSPRPLPDHNRLNAL